MSIPIVLHLCTIAASFIPTVPFDGPTRVILQNESDRSGIPDPSTDATHLRLRVGDSRAFIVFGIPWSDIREIQAGEQIWSGPDLAKYRDELAQLHASAPADNTELEPDRPESDRERVVEPPRPAPKPIRVHFLEVDASAENWDSDAEWDGIVLRVRPIGGSGEWISARGTLDVTLAGDRAYSVPHLDSTTTRIQRIGHWTRVIQPTDFGPNGAVIRLEFQDVAPERWLGNSFGDVHVRLNIPGQGSFSATANSVRLRRFSPVRDRFWRQYGPIHYPFE